ncbi:hypothetical protein FBD94_20540 [Pedobacter hiemivivus]|uniref:Uncharacterized protein n=2 Tax=Pedobacter hiemivivus TaxID=2530454 RepID=A0A4U1G5I6_9SPHI|nr:hypothetical protein EZ444_08545 [Pedobacter hiemivivus]TKC57753.1 hypothetical protein FBD94_20540 [Pedobacter hiemivivus]
MGYAKERGKLEQLIVKIASINTYDQKSLAILVDSYEKYSHTVRILKNKNADSFMDLYTNELQAIKEAKKTLRESDSDENRQLNFVAYKASIVSALEKTIKTTLDTL